MKKVKPQLDLYQSATHNFMRGKGAWSWRLLRGCHVLAQGNFYSSQKGALEGFKTAYMGMIDLATCGAIEWVKGRPGVRFKEKV